MEPYSRRLKLIIERVVHRGWGLSRVAGKAVFVPAVIPGETVECELIEDRPTYARAKLRNIIMPSPHRVAPACASCPACGGCSFLHIAYPHQLELKTGILLETLSRLGKIVPGKNLEKIIPAPSPLHYRSRLRFHLRSGRLGFKAFEGSELVEITDCLLARPELAGAMPALKDLARERKAEKELELDLNPETGKIHAILSGREKKFYLLEQGKFHKVSPPKKEFLALMAFSQANPEQNQTLRALAAEMAQAFSGRRGLELFAGAGNLSFALAQKLERLVAVELNLRAVQLAEMLRQEQKADHIQFVAAGAESYLQRCLKSGEKFGLVALDPPRTGAKKEIPFLIKLSPQAVIYISCEPATLARDLRMLLDAGYELVRMVPLDLFPQTYHLETITLLRKA